MATIRFETGQVVNFEGNPTPQDIEEVAAQLGIRASQPQAKTEGQGGFLNTAASITGGKELAMGLGRTISNAMGTGNDLLKLSDQHQESTNTLYKILKDPKTSPEQKARVQKILQNNPNHALNAYDNVTTGGLSNRQILGSAGQLATNVASLALPVPKTLGGSIGQFGALGAAATGAGSIAEGKNYGQAAQDALVGGALGAGVGGVFNLLGKTMKAAGPAALSFTSGIPKKALLEGAKNSSVAKQGLTMSVEQIRNNAVKSLGTLYKELGDEFAGGLDDVVKTTGQTKAGMTYGPQGFLKSSNKARTSLTEYGRNFAREFRIGTKTTPQGIELNFDLSPIVKGGEKSNVQEAFRTISTWKDFSARGMQDLAERVGALRNFESGAKTESSAVIGKLYNKIAGTGGVKGLIPELYPDLAKLRTKFAQNKKVLDEIQNVLSADKTKPVAIQGSITRLSNLFKEDKDGYMRIIKELSDRSGVDYQALLAGTEFQKVLPGFVRGLGGGGALAVGGALLNPYLLLLAPLFSPRFAGLVSRNATSVGNAAGVAGRVGTTQTLPRLFQGGQPTRE